VISDQQSPSGPKFHAAHPAACSSSQSRVAADQPPPRTDASHPVSDSARQMPAASTGVRDPVDRTAAISSFIPAAG
jgi:hypothetical protein